MNNFNTTFLVLDFRKEYETRKCLESIKGHALFPHKTILLDNGAFDLDYPNELYKEGLCDILIRKKNGMGGGYGQVDLFRYCDTEYAIFVQNDQELVLDITEHTIKYFKDTLYMGYSCIDLNGDQSGKGIWTDRAHMILTDFFNDLGPFPCGGPGLDNIKWNEQYLQEKFTKNNYKIFHPPYKFFKDCGKWSIRESGDGLYRHRTDTKIMFVEKTPSYKTDVFPPFDEADWELALSGNWPIEGKVPNLWKGQVFKCWED